MTFLELYRTLTSFVLYKLYTDENLVYPPPLDVEQDERGETVGAFRLVEKKATGAAGTEGVSKKAVKRAIKGISASGAAGDDEDVEMDDDEDSAEADEDFVERPSKNAEVEDVVAGPLPTYTSLLASSDPSSSKKQLIFSPYTFYLSRETSSRTWEFVIRAMGGKVVTSLAAAAPGEAPQADSITHVLIDRPMTDERRREMQGDRKWTWVQPQWVADCVNRQKVLGAEEYGPGKLLPPHLSPWDGEGELQRPWLEQDRDVAEEAAEDDEDEPIAAEEEDSDDDEEEQKEAEEPTYPPALLAAAQNPKDKSLVHQAELEAEANGTPHATFKAQLKEATKKFGPSTKGKKAEEEDPDMRKVMMSNKKRRLFEKMQYSNAERQAEKDKLEARRKEIEKRKKKEAMRGAKKGARAGR